MGMNLVAHPMGHDIAAMATQVPYCPERSISVPKSHVSTPTIIAWTPSSAATEGQKGDRGEVNRSLKFLSKLWPLSQVHRQTRKATTVMTTILEKGGCSLGTQRVTTKQPGRRSRERGTNRQENETLHFY